MMKSATHLGADNDVTSRLLRSHPRFPGALVWKAVLLQTFRVLILAGMLLIVGANAPSPAPSPDLKAMAAGAEGAHPTMGNPAAVHCRDLGYEYGIVDGEGGAQRGICTLPGGEDCDAWEFLQGKCGQMHSYCARQGYEIRTVSDGKDPFSPEHAVCVTDEGVVAGSVAELTGLSEKATGCGEETSDDNSLPTTEEGETYVPPLDGDPPTSFDWRSYQGSNWLTAIRNQGGCGSCWAFSAVGVTEAAHNIANNDPNLDKDLSEQYLVSDCHTYYDYQTCCGGSKSLALSYIRDSGIPDEGCMSYVDGGGCSCGGGSCDSNCTYNTGDYCSDRTCSDRCGDWSSRLEYIVSTGSVSSDAQTIKQALVDRGPLAVSMGIGSSYGGYWDGDIYRCSSDTGTNHAVIIVGYDDAGGYWWVRNSWGTGWGDSGYFKLGYGECYVEEYVYYADARALSVGPLEYHSHTIDDDASGGSSGNGDGVVHCGETIEMPLTLYNQGSDTATGVEAVLSTSDGYISITDSQENYPDISGGGTSTCTYDYDFQVDADTPDGHTINFALDITASNGGPWTDSFDVTVSCATNNPPHTPGNPTPADGATSVSTSTDLSWSGGDPDSGDTVTYDVYFGTANPPTTLLCNDTSSTTCDPGSLSYNTPYYWYVVATDNHGATATGATWNFTTESAPDVGPLVYDSYLVDDDASGQSSGDDDGIADCGENIELYVDLLNQGTDTATSVTATISTSDPYVTWLYNVDSTYPDIAGGATGRNSGDYDFALDAGAPDGHLIQFDLDITASNGGPWTDSFQVPVTCVTDETVVINEVDLGDYDAVELFNPGTSSIDVTGWLFTAIRSGSVTSYTVPSFTLGAGSYVVVHEESGTDTQTDLYMGDNIYWMNESDGSASLVDGSGQGVDFVRWGGSTDSPPAGTGWTGTNPASPPAGYNLGRDALSTDTDDGSDWCGQTSTLGAQNGSCITNYPPYTPGSPTPADGATAVSTSTDLSWSGGDPDAGDTVTYDVYFGTANPPTTLLCNDTSSTTCDPGALAYDTLYHWYVVATDNHSATATGATWDFTSEPIDCNDPHEPNDTLGEATAISYGTSLSDPNICPAGDVDYYAFAANAGDVVIANVDAQALGSSLDSYLYLYDTDGVTELASNDDQNGLDSYIAYELPADGTYYLMVRDYSHPNEGGTDYGYTLSLSLAPPLFDVDAGWSSTAPTVDGHISTGEWDAASSYEITLPASTSAAPQEEANQRIIHVPDSPFQEKGNRQASSETEINQLAVTLYAMNDGTYLYLALDNPHDTTDNPHDQMGIYFDDNPLPSDGQWTNTTCGNADGEGNFWVITDTVEYREIVAGPTFCDSLAPAPGTSGAIAHSSGHAQAEIALDLSSSALRAGPDDTLGMHLWIYDGETGTLAGKWPITANFADPATYGSLTLASMEMPAAFSKSSPVDGATGLATAPTLDWGSSSGATGYEVCIDTTDDDTCAAGWTSVGSDTTVNLSGLNDGTTYYWQVRARNAAGTTEADGGTWWDFTTEAVVCNDPHEPNDSWGEATSIGYGTTLSDPDICSAGDVDYYALTGSVGDTIIIDIDAQAIGSSLDSYLILYGTDGVTWLAYNDDDDGRDSHLEYTLPAAGTYYLMVREYGHPDVGGTDCFYTLTLSSYQFRIYLPTVIRDGP